MAGDELEIVRLRNDFYRDGFYKVFTALAVIVTAIILFCALSAYLFLEKPKPVTFPTDKGWRILPPVPVDQAYLSSADFLQWASDALLNSFTFDFVNYPDQLNTVKKYYTDAGFAKLSDVLNTYVNASVVNQAKLFINASPAAAPFILNQGLLSGSYAWWVQMPVVLHYSSVDKQYDTTVTLQALVVRVPTTDNLSGVLINDLVEVKAAKANNNNTKP